MILLLSWLAGCTGTEEVEPPPPLPDSCVSPSESDTGSDDSAFDTGDTATGDWLTGCEVLELPDLVTARYVHLWLAEPGSVRLCCVHQTDSEEVHLVHSSADARDHLLSLQGLLAGANYECIAEVTTGELVRQVVITLSTDPLPNWIRLPELSGDPDRSFGAYTLLNHSVNGKAVDDQKFLIFDSHGQVRWYLDLPDDITYVDATYLGDGQLL